MQIPESYYHWILAAGGVPKFHATYDTLGRVVLEGVAPTTASDSDNAWTIQQTLYANGQWQGYTTQSTLRDVSWSNAILGLLTFP